MSKILAYQDVQLRIFRYYPVYCRSKLQQKKRWGKGWVDNELEVGYALDEMEGSFEHPIEDLMFYTMGLILFAGRESEFTRNVFSEKIKKIISAHGLGALLKTVSDADSLQIKLDLEIVGIV